MPRIPPRPSARLIKVLRYIDAHLAHPISLEDMARAVKMSPYHFAHRFKEKTGLPPMRYVWRKRLERAMHLLRHSDMPISQVALAAGFASQAHLTTTFRRALDTTPAAYRRGSTDPQSDGQNESGPEPPVSDGDSGPPA